MDMEKMIDLLNEDLAREMSHQLFYQHAASVVSGLEKDSLSALFSAEATQEVQHVDAFRKLIIGLGGNPYAEPVPYKDVCEKKDLLAEAIRMEEEVVAIYVERQDQAAQLELNGGQDKVDGRYIALFLDQQIVDSRGDVDELKQLARNLR